MTTDPKREALAAEVNLLRDSIKKNHSEGAWITPGWDAHNVLKLLARVGDALQAAASQREGEVRDAQHWRTIVPRLLDELRVRDRGDGNAPGHAHAVPGVWDSDNGKLAGTKCAWCAVWAEAKSALTAPATSIKAQAGDSPEVLDGPQ